MLHVSRCLALISLILVLMAGSADADSQPSGAEYARRLYDHYIPTIQFVTALSGDQLGLVAAGGALELGALSDSKQQAILAAAELAYVGYPSGYSKWHDNLPPGGRVLVWCAPEFSLTLASNNLRPSGRETLSVSDLTPGLARPRSAAGFREPESRPHISNPPVLESLLAQAPTEPEARSAWARNAALELLSAVGDFWLRRAEVPLSVADFDARRALTLGSLSAEQKTWLKGIYTKHCVGILARQELLRKANAWTLPTADTETHVIVDAQTGISADVAKTPRYQLPLWTELADATTLTLSVRYRLRLELAGAGNGTCPNSIGWSLE